MYYIHMLRCKDNSIYTGITTNLERRMKDHFTRNSRCAKYTLTHHAKTLQNVFCTDSRENASKLEYRIKKLSKYQKEQLIRYPEKIGDFFSEVISCEKYSSLKFREMPNLAKYTQI